jgi:acyl-CoA thioester hydrolase
MGHAYALRVYYEDTDLAGIVYYANYLKFIERARTEWVRGLGVDQRALKAAGLVFAVRRIEADYLRPARFDDELVVQTSVRSVTGARMVLQQDVTLGPERLFAAQVVLVCLTDSGQPARLPAELRAMLVGDVEEGGVNAAGQLP